MKEKQQKHNDGNYPENDSTVLTEEKVLILQKVNANRNLDQTIKSADRYVSWYQYKTSNIDKYLQLCPHCKKPTMSAFDRSVIDSAIDYLNGKRMFNHYPKSEKNFFPIITFLLAIGTALYFLINYI